MRLPGLAESSSCALSANDLTVSPAFICTSRLPPTSFRKRIEASFFSPFTFSTFRSAFSILKYFLSSSISPPIVLMSPLLNFNTHSCGSSSPSVVSIPVNFTGSETLPTSMTRSRCQSGG